MCGSDVALRQITLTACFFLATTYFSHSYKVNSNNSDVKLTTDLLWSSWYSAESSARFLAAEKDTPRHRLVEDERVLVDTADCRVEMVVEWSKVVSTGLARQQ